MSLEFSKRVKFESESLPVCGLRTARHTPAVRVKTVCGDALVGTGYLDYTGDFPGAQGGGLSFRFTADLYNGRVSGRPAILARLQSPQIGSLHTDVLVCQMAKSDDTTRLVGKLPSIKAQEFEVGYTQLRMSLHRRYRADGEVKSFVSASCPSAYFPLPDFQYARFVTVFRDGLEASGP